MYTAPMAPDPWTSTLGGMAMAIRCDVRGWWYIIYGIDPGTGLECARIRENVESVVLPKTTTCLYLSMPMRSTHRIVGREALA